MPKIIQINVTANWGSTGKIVESIGISAIQNGWESFIAYGRCCSASTSQLIRIGSDINSYLHFCEQRIKDNEGLCSRNATKKLIKRIQAIKPDIIQLHNIHDHYINYQLLFEYLNNTDIKIVWTFHDCWAFTGHCFHFVTKQCDKWKVGCCQCPLRNIRPKTLYDNSKKNYELKKSLFCESKNLTIVCCSEWMAKFVKQSFLKDKRIQVIHNGIDINVFKKASNADKVDNDGMYNVIAVSNVWYKDKGINDIYELRKALDENYRITVVGLSPKQIKSLPQGINGIQRTQNIRQLVLLYSSSDVLINPTYADTFPTVNLEALACGIPVITYNTGGSPEAIDIDTGVVVQQGNGNELAKAIIKMKESPLSSTACRDRAELYFDKDKCFEEYLILYKELLGLDKAL